MKTIKIALFSLLVAGSVSSCDFLEKEPYKIVPENYFQDEDEVISSLTGVYSTLAIGGFYGNTYMNLVAGDDLTYYGGGTKRISTTGLICNNATTADGSVLSLWQALYTGIDRANFLLEQIDRVKDMSDENRQRYKAEARFLRAFYYFNLVQHWGDVPFKLESTYASQSVENKDIARTDKNKIYDFITREMAEVADEETGGLLSAQVLSYRPGHVSKSAAWGILARVYLFWAGEHYRDDQPAPAETQERFRLASFYAQKVMTQGHGLADNYADIFIDMCSEKYNTTANESIWEVEFAGDYTGSVRSEGRIGNINGPNGGDYSSDPDVTGISDPGYAYGFLICTPKLWELYVDNEDKERRYWNLMPFSYRGAGKLDDGTVPVKGIVGRTFQDKDAFDWVTGPNGYQARSFDYDGVNEGEGIEKITNTMDIRGDVYLTAAPPATGPRLTATCGKFRREYEPYPKKSKNFTSVNFPILRYSDVLLMIAEAENEANDGPTELAYNCLNQVRGRAGVEQNARDYISLQRFRQAVKDERAMELCFEYTRRGDLIRWGEFVEKMNALVTRAQNGVNWGEGPQAAPFFRVSSAYRYFPIPEAEKAVNKLITGNNPGW